MSRRLPACLGFIRVCPLILSHLAWAWMLKCQHYGHSLPPKHVTSSLRYCSILGEMSTITAGGGQIDGGEIFWRIWKGGGVYNFIEGSQVGTVKIFWVILPQICMWILRHDWSRRHAGGMNTNDAHSRGGQRKLSVCSREAMTILTITKHFNPPIHNCWQLPQYWFSLTRSQTPSPSSSVPLTKRTIGCQQHSLANRL